MPRPRTSPLTAMEQSLKLAQDRVTDLKAEVVKAEADVVQFERCVKILKDQLPTSTLIPASASTKGK